MFRYFGIIILVHVVLSLFEPKTNCQPAMIDVSQSSSEVDASAVAKHTKEPTQRLSAPITSAQSW